MMIEKAGSQMDDESQRLGSWQNFKLYSFVDKALHITLPTCLTNVCASK